MTSPGRPACGTPPAGDNAETDSTEIDSAEPSRTDVDSAVWTLRVWRETSAAAGVRARIIAVTMDGLPARQTAVTDSIDDVLARLRTFLQHTTANWSPPAVDPPASQS